jgi:hypothetical protein
MKLTGENRQLGEKPVPVPLCPPQTPHGLIRDRTWASACGRPATNRLSHDTAITLPLSDPNILLNTLFYFLRVENNVTQTRFYRSKVFWKTDGMIGCPCLRIISVWTTRCHRASWVKWLRFWLILGKCLIRISEVILIAFIVTKAFLSSSTQV